MQGTSTMAQGAAHRGRMLRCSIAAAVVVFQASACRVDTYFDTAKVDMRAIKEGIHVYRQNRGALPASVEAMAPPRCAGSECVLKNVRHDPWNHTYQLRQKEGRTFIASRGPDGKWDTADDIDEPAE